MLSTGAGMSLEKLIWIGDSLASAARFKSGSGSTEYPLDIDAVGASKAGCTVQTESFAKDDVSEPASCLMVCSDGVTPIRLCPRTPRESKLPCKPLRLTASRTDTKFTSGSSRSGKLNDGGARPAIDLSRCSFARAVKSSSAHDSYVQPENSFPQLETPFDAPPGN